MNSITIAKFELLRLFKSPLAWLGLAVIQFLLALFFLVSLYEFRQPEAAALQPGLTETVIVAVVQACGFLLMILTPILTMRLFSDEFRTGTIDLLLSAPISITEIVIGKYLGILLFNFCIILLLCLMLLSLGFGTQLDTGLFLSAILGLLLLSTSFVAIGMFMSSLTAQPAIAATCSFVTMFMLWIMHVAANAGGELLSNILAYLSLLQHFNHLLLGLVSTTDVFYFILLSTLFIVLTIWRLDARLLHE